MPLGERRGRWATTRAAAQTEPPADGGGPYPSAMGGAGTHEGLHDEHMLEEIELVSELVMAASAAPARRLTSEEVDRALGL